MMKEALIRWLTAIATDSRVLADYQDDPTATMARFGLSERDMKEFVASLREQLSSTADVAAAVTEDDMLTH